MSTSALSYHADPYNMKHEICTIMYCFLAHFERSEQASLAGMNREADKAICHRILCS